MRQSVNFSAFVDAFRAYGRESQFSFEALHLLFEYLEQLEEDGGREIELAVIALCCAYSESTLEDINRDYGEAFEDIDDAEAWLSERTMVCGQSDDGIVYSQF